jgi:hypothetical protein
MSVLSVIQNLTLIGLKRPTAVFSSQDQEHFELATLANRAKDDILSGHDWRALTRLETITGDGVKTEWDMPAGFDRFTEDNDGKAQIVTPILVGPMVQIRDLQTWLNIEVRQLGRITYSWILLGDKINIKPALPVGVHAYYYYQTNLCVKPSSLGTNQPKFTKDDETFVLDETLLEYGIQWMWRHEHRQSYAEDMATYERRKERLIMRDGGPKKLSFGRSHHVSTEIAYPFELR